MSIKFLVFYKKRTAKIKLRDEYDLNDIAEISYWIKGSLSNDNYPNYEPPLHVLKLLSILMK